MFGTAARRSVRHMQRVSLMNKRRFGSGHGAGAAEQSDATWWFTILGWTFVSVALPACIIRSKPVSADLLSRTQAKKLSMAEFDNFDKHAQKRVDID